MTLDGPSGRRLVGRTLQQSFNTKLV